MSDEYDEGLREGRIRALEVAVQDLAKDLQELIRANRTQERVLWMIIGAGLFIQVWPVIREMLK